MVPLKQRSCIMSVVFHPVQRNEDLSLCSTKYTLYALRTVETWRHHLTSQFPIEFSWDSLSLFSVRHRISLPASKSLSLSLHLSSSNLISICLYLYSYISISISVSSLYLFLHLYIYKSVYTYISNLQLCLSI